MAAENLNVPVDETNDNNELVTVSNRKRKPNFSPLEVAIITEKFEENRSILTAKLNNIVTNKSKNKLWDNITAAVNAVGVAKRSTHDVKEKWRNLAGTARKELAFYRKESRKTGGGPPPKKPSETSEKILQFLGETPSFIGVDGFETGLGSDFPLSLSAGIPEIEPAASFSMEANDEEAPFNSTTATGTVNLDELELTEFVPVVEARKITPLVTASVEPASKAHRRKKTTVTADDVLQAQHEALVCKKETLQLKKKKLELQIRLLEKQLTTE